jgi:RHS repeat-associated protein
MIQAAARRRWLESPRVRAQREASQMEFHGLSRGRSQQLLVRDYGEQLAGASANPAASIADEGRIVRYLSDYKAVVKTADGFELKTSTVPLRVAGSGGVKGPVDLGLVSKGGGFAPARPLAAVSIARDSAGEATVGSDGLGMTLEGSTVSGSEVGGQSVFFGGVASDTDAVVAPRIDGAEFLAVLRSRLSPEHLRYRLSLPAGAVLRADGGGAVVSRAGSVLAQIPAPTARDAQGVVVPVEMSVVGDELLLTIQHRSSDLAYPLLVDPTLVTVTNSSEGWTFVEGGEEYTRSVGSGISLSVSAPENYGYKFGNYRYVRSTTQPEVDSVEFQGLSFSGSAKNNKGESVEAVQWVVLACESGTGESSAPPTNVVLGWSHIKTCIERKSLFNIEFGLYVEGDAVSATGSFSASAIVLTEEWPRDDQAEEYGPENESQPSKKHCTVGDPVNCATGNLTETQTDLAVGGRGPALAMTRTYNSQLAVGESEHGPFGYGWTGPYSAHLVLTESCESCIETATVDQNNGSTTSFTKNPGEQWQPVAPLVQAKLTEEGTGYVYTLPNQAKLEFNSEGRLTKETDRNGNSISLAYNTEKQLEAATDGAGRKLTFKYNGSGEVESVTDPAGHAVKYTYESGNLTSVTQPGETKIRWKFKYNSEHELTSVTDGREHATTMEYNEANQVKSQTDPLSRKRTWRYEVLAYGSLTEVTEPNGAVTRDEFNTQGLPTSVTHAYGTSLAATTTYEYNEADELIAVTDPDKHKTEYGYDSAGDLTSEKNADGDEKKWTYDSTHDIDTETTPDGETTTIKRNGAGDPEVIERPAPGSTTQKTTYKYDADGDVESMTNPLERTWKYEYDSYGDRKAEIDPEGNKRTWEYNEDSQEIATVSPRGNAEGAEASKFTTKIELNAKGQPLKITDPLGHTTKYTYDGDGNVETMTDGNSHKTKYTYDANNELTKTEEPNKTVTETEYDSMGQVKSQTDGNKHVTKYVRNALEEVEEVVSPLGKKTLKEYDAAGNLVKLTDSAKRTITYTHDPANRLTEVSYSSGNPATVKYEYNKDGDRTKMTDGTGTTTYTYDQLDRMTESENGHKEVIKYEYNLGNQQTKITYPNTKAVERAYDKDGRLEKITDWNKKETKFAYNEDSELKKITFPSGTKDEDTYAYNDTDQMTEVKMKKSSETLGSLVYTRDDDNQVKKTTSKDLPGAEVTENTYDENNRLTKSGSTEYKYDAANNPTTEGSSINTFNEGDELEKGTGVTYSYDELGERTKTTPETGTATTYGYDQAGNLISVERPEKESVSKIEDSYAYNGEGLRTSQTISGTTTYMAWDMAEELPLILSDGTNSYIYGPGELPVEQINNSTGTTLYLHHDQQGSTRLLTGSTGKNEGAYTYTPYGAVQEHTGTSTTPLGYDAQYTSSDTGLIYMRARTYDPTTGQFLSIDPMVETTRAPYTYASDNPFTDADPTGLVASPCEIARGKRLEELHKILKRETKEIEEERHALQEEPSYGEEVISKAVKVVGGCLTGSDVGTVIGGEIGVAAGGPAGGLVGVVAGGPVGCAVGGASAGLSPVNPLQPSEGSP